MAILKHISSRNSSYVATIKYLSYKHDEFKNEPLLDENGFMIPRENMLIDALNVSEVDMFPVECLNINKKYNQNRFPTDVKSHHFIISFDPKDIPDHNLTVESAHALALDYASKCFPGYQAVVATHEDGHNGSHNIHSHIVINSTRMMDIKLQAFMDRDADCKAGKKIRVTDAFMKYLKKELMDICEANGLYQVDLLSPAKVKVTEREYHLCRRKILSGNTSFRSDKDILRETIFNVMAKAKSFYEFCDILESENDIKVSVINNHIYYDVPDQTSPIRAKALGSIFDYENVTTKLAMNNRYTPKEVIHYQTPYTLRHLIDIANNKKAQENYYYAQKLTLLNISIKAQTANLLALRNDVVSLASLEDSMNEALENMKAADKRYKELASTLKTINAQIKYTGQYWAYKDIYKQYMSLPQNKKEQFFEDNRAPLTLYMAAKDFLADKTINGKLPTVKMLREKKAELTSLRNTYYEEKLSTQRAFREASTLYENTKLIDASYKKRQKGRFDIDL